MQKKSFIRSGEGAIASYDWTEIAEGSGIINFYLFQSSITNNLKISNKIVASTNPEYITNFDVMTGEYVKHLDISFNSLPFNFPKIVAGTAIFNFCGVGIRGSGSGNAQGYFKAILKKYDGSTETEIGNGTTNIPVFNTQSKQIETCLIIINLTQTKFKKGEILRLTIEGYLKSANGDLARIGLGTDPLNRDGAEITPSTNSKIFTKSVVYVPFKIEI